MSKDRRGAAALPEGFETFNGFRKLNSALVPMSLLSVPTETLTWFDKVLYGRLRFDAGNSDRCEVVLSGLADELNVSLDSVSRSIDRLAKAGLVYRLRLRYFSLVVFLKSDLLKGSIRKGADSAVVRTLDILPESAAERSVDSPESAAVRFQSPQPCGLESAAERSAYKEDLGFTRIRKEQAAAERNPGCPEEAAACSLPSQTENPTASAQAVSVVTAALSAQGVPSDPADVITILSTAKALEIGPEGLALFIAEKCERKRKRDDAVEHARFFRTSVPADLPAWKTANAERLALVDQPPPCPKCRNKGFVSSGPEWEEDTVKTLCDCEKGQARRPQFSLSPTGCHTCRGKLAYRPAHSKHLMCANCMPPEMVTRAELRIVAGEMDAFFGLPPGEQFCANCNKTGQIKTGRNTVDVAVAFCDCAHGRMECEKRGHDWPVIETEKLRAIEKENAEFDLKHQAICPGPNLSIPPIPPGRAVVVQHRRETSTDAAMRLVGERIARGERPF